MSTKIIALRGATTVNSDEVDEISAATVELLNELLEANRIAAGEVISIIFSATSDLTALYPATAARALGWTETPMLCVQEMHQPGSLHRCIRILAHAHISIGAKPKHIYLRDAAGLRPDWVG